MTALESNEYVLGTNNYELVRLGYQHRVWLEAAAGIWKRAGFGLGQTILDVGSGPGYASIDLAQLVGPEGKIIAAEVSDRFINHLNKTAEKLGYNNIETILVDVQQLEIKSESVDGAYARWVLCFVENPESVIERVATSLKQGGTFAVQDYSHYLGVSLLPPSEVMDRVVDAVEKSWRLNGGDPNVAKRVPAMMAKYGLEIQDVRPLVNVAKPGSALWNWPPTFFKNYLPVLESMGLLTNEDCIAWHEEWERYSNNPASRFQTPPMLEIIGVKK